MVFRGFAIPRRSVAFFRRLVARLTFWAGAVAVGVVAVGFAELTDWVGDHFQRGARSLAWLPFLLTPTIGIIAAWLTRRHFSGIEGSGIPQVMAELSRRHDDTWPPLVSLKLAFGKIMVGVMAIGGGFSFGREGPTVQVGASIMSSIEPLMPRATEIQRKHLLIVGGAAGIAAAFNTPLAGIIFAIEELNRGIESRLSGLIITGIVLAGVISQALIGNHSYYGEILVTGNNNSTTMEVVLASALVTGVLGGMFAYMLNLAASGWSTPLARLRRLHPYRFVIVCGLILAALGWATGGVTYGSGYRQTLTLLDGNTEYPWYFGPAKYIATLVSYLSGLPGGIFAPSLAIGAGIGHDLFLMIGEDAPAGMLLVFCMTGFLAAVTQAPITSFVIVMEMVDGYDLIIGLMATALIASGISTSISQPLYHFLSETILRNKRRPPDSGARL